VHILTQPRNALVRQYRRLFALEGVKLDFDPAALIEIAHQAITRGTGARGLRAITERLLLDIMYDLPSDDSIESVTVTAAAVKGAGPLVIRHKTKRKKESA
jgi:ATP-dependent Clp protease ATP-binding subunit ClpX